MFSLPTVIGGEEVMMPLTISISICLFIGAFGALFLYNIQLPSHPTDQGLADNDRGENNPIDQEANTSFVRNALRLAGKSFISCFTCLSAYSWLAALAIDSQKGIGIQGIGTMNLIGAITQAITSFIGPLLVGSGNFQF